ncbi:hypothetical protein BGZ89_004598 [Linnemannia elongata]|nr:hypothetical protein BGZ89_004598 [Linnemannia elongata]
MTENPLTLFCLVDGESTSNAFPVGIESTKTIGDLKDLIKAKKTIDFSDVDANKLTLWRIFIPDDNLHSAITVDALDDKTELDNPRTHDLHIDIKKIREKFFAPGAIVDFLVEFVKGEIGHLSITSGPIRGLPRAWHRTFRKPPETRPNLLFLDLPDPSTPDSVSRNYASTPISDMVKENTSLLIPMFGVSGCGKTRAAIELLSQHWGFYFNASDDDWGSGDMSTLRSMVQSLFRQILKLRRYSEDDLWEVVTNLFDKVKHYLINHGNLPKIDDVTKLLVVHDEAQILGDAFNDAFLSTSSKGESPRLLLSPILNAFLEVGGDYLTVVTCGTDLSINTLFWVQSSGSGMKDSSTDFEYMEFPGFTDLESIKAYVSRVRRCLLDDESRWVFDEHLPQDALDTLLDKLGGRFRPAILALERIIEQNDLSAWMSAIEYTEDRLVSWSHRDIKGNLCNELDRLHNKNNKYKDQLVESIDSILGILMYTRCMFGDHKLVLGQVDPLLVELAFGRVKIIHGRAVTVVDEPFVSKAVENYFIATDPYFKNAVRRIMRSSTASAQGCVFEQFMMSVFTETFTMRPLSEWPHQPPILDMCPALVGEVEIVGWREPGVEQGTTYKNISMQEFMDTHVNHHSARNNKPVAPFFFPKSKPSGPDMVFFIRIHGCRVVPVFVQKLHQSSSSFSEKNLSGALSTVSAPKIESHAEDFRDYCPDNVYISMIVAYPTKWSSKLSALSDLPKDTSGVQQVVINVSDNNFGKIFPKEHVEFIDRLKNMRK